MAVRVRGRVSVQQTVPARSKTRCLTLRPAIRPAFNEQHQPSVLTSAKRTAAPANYRQHGRTTAGTGQCPVATLDGDDSWWARGVFYEVVPTPEPHAPQRVFVRGAALLHALRLALPPLRQRRL